MGRSAVTGRFRPAGGQRFFGQQFRELVLAIARPVATAQRHAGEGALGSIIFDLQSAVFSLAHKLVIPFSAPRPASIINWVVLLDSTLHWLTTVLGQPTMMAHVNPYDTLATSDPSPRSLACRRNRYIGAEVQRHNLPSIEQSMVDPERDNKTYD